MMSSVGGSSNVLRTSFLGGRGEAAAGLLKHG